MKAFRDVASAPGGEFVVVWNDSAIGGKDLDTVAIIARAFDAGGSPIPGGPWLIADTNTNLPHPASVAAHGNGDFVVTWHRFDYPYPLSVFAERRSADGSTIGTEFKVNTGLEYKQVYPDVGVDSVGNFVVTWNVVEYDGSEADVLAQRFDADANRLGRRVLRQFLHT